MTVTAIVGGGTTSMLRALLQSDTVRDGIVDAQIRSLIASRPIDVASPNRHRMMHWFNGRIPRAPQVVDFAKQDFPLVAGRIDVIGAVPVPTLVYGYAKHLIKLTGGSAGVGARQFGTGPERGQRVQHVSLDRGRGCLLGGLRHWIREPRQVRRLFYRRQSSAPIHMPAQECGFRPAFTASDATSRENPGEHQFSRASSFVRVAISLPRARARRDITVPIGTPVTSAISR